MPPRSTLVNRVAWGAALAAAAAALLAAVSTSALAAFLLQRAEDRRLHEAALVLAREISEPQSRGNDIENVVQEEREETRHTGILFAVFNAKSQRVAGDKRVTIIPARGECETAREDTLRSCSELSSNALIAVAASAPKSPTALFAFSAFIATLLAGCVAWLASHPISHMTIAPLSNLRSKLEAFDADAGKVLDLGPMQNVVEVDQLRETIMHLMRRVNRAIDQAQRFAANAAHELRTPLTTVRAELDLLAEQPAMNADSTANIGRVVRKVSELNILVERLLVLATPKSALLDVAEIVSLRDLIEDAVATLSTENRQRVKLIEADAFVKGDEVLLSTMVTNALGNALKFGRDVTISIETSINTAVLYFDDNGPGVRPDDRERVFEPFARTGDTVQLRIPGHGLGLALIRHIAENHGGQASFIDKPSQGARLALRLPIATDS